MKNKLKRQLYVVLTLIIFIFSIVSNNISVNAKDADTKNIDLVIVFKENSIDENVEKVIVESGGKIVNEYSNLGGIEVKCSPKLISTIKSIDSVQSLAPNHSIKISTIQKSQSIKESTYDSSNITGDLFNRYQWDIKRVTNNGESFSLESGNHDVVVGIIDSGVDIHHPDLISNFLGGKNLVPASFKNDQSETGDINDISDRLGHGTNVAGFIAANGRTKGVAPNIGFKSYRIFNKNGETTATICSSAIIEATNDGVKVINLSIGGYDLKGKCYWTNPETGIKYNLGNDVAEYSLYKRAIKYAIDRGVTVVSAAGNECQDCSNKTRLTSYLNELYKDKGLEYTGLTYEVPGTVKNVITVAATGKDDVIASYSNYGKDFINISAPGGDVLDTFNINNMCLTTNINSGYTFDVGTSFAAPKVTAIAAIAICKDKNLTPKEVGKIIYKTADKLSKDEESQYYGAGMVNVYNVIQYMNQQLKNKN